MLIFADTSVRATVPFNASGPVKRADDKGLRSSCNPCATYTGLHRRFFCVASSYRFHPECFALVADIDEVKTRASRQLFRILNCRQSRPHFLQRYLYFQRKPMHVRDFTKLRIGAGHSRPLDILDHRREPAATSTSSTPSSSSVIIMACRRYVP